MFVRECRILPLDFDGASHQSRALDLVKEFKVSHCYQDASHCNSDVPLPGLMTHDVNVVAVFDYILPLMVHKCLLSWSSVAQSLEQPGLFRFMEVNDNNDLAHRVHLINSNVAVFYFCQFPLISDVKVIEMIENIIRHSALVTPLECASPKDRIVRLLKNSKLLGRRSPTYTSALPQQHIAILDVCTLMDSYPYAVERAHI
ncbi:uncharacterized protein LAESUDRAFT_712978 [Laetiporus sulphureus 93-53]|uniref:Uncharacterized protein n=1 Tax=Laetiporus sulphureus 93-53 TaxID=1314785 RepID=A0A165F6F9_9APHY|nr:uncharacterized protein LAESUDRAFT_712978 [Laetiporus sulphureus 93-53]KZT08483.1 hypothetical protein LAESUDRAFT_712978 [Laetiporus sulphureus 93-53]